MDATITVKILHQPEESELVTGSGQVTVFVLPRSGWKPNLKAMYAKRTTPTPIRHPPEPWGSRSFGRYYNGWAKATYRHSPREETGPWEGTRYMKNVPDLNGREAIYVHTDLYADKGEAYPNARDNCGEDKPALDEANLAVMNAACKTSGVLKNWREYVKRHEKAHQDSYDKCIRSETMRRLAGIFEGVAATPADMWGAITTAAKEEIHEKVTLATRSNQRWDDPEGLWAHRWAGKWEQVEEGESSHNGTDGCS